MSTKSIAQSNVRAAFLRKTSRLRHGCAWFIWPLDAPDRDPHNAGGWMSIEGRPATWFNAPKDLPQDVVWWTNLEPASAWSLGRSTHIKPDGFLGLDWFALLSRWGRPIGPEAIKSAVSLWSELFTRLSYQLDLWCAELAKPENPLENPNNLPSPDWSWGEGDFQEALGRRLGIPFSGGPNGVNSKSPPGFDNAWCVQVYADWPANRIEGKRKLSLMLNPIKHAELIRNTRVPFGSWRELSPGQWPLQDERKWEWLENNQEQPLLLRFDNQPQAQPAQDEFLRVSWGRRGRRFPGAPFETVWMTGEEALALRPYLVTAPTSVWIAEGWEAGPSPPWRVADSEDPLEGCSMLCSLKEGAFWRSWATPLRNDKRLRPTPSALAVWWRMADRMNCLKAAIVCQEEGLDVISYGNGQVIVAFDEDRQLIDWEKPIRKSGLMVPRDLSEIARLPDKIEMNAEVIEKWLLTSKQPLEAWFCLDRMMAPWLIDDRNELKIIMSSSLQALSQIPPPNGAPNTWSSDWRALLLNRSRTELAKLLPSGR